MSDSTIGAPLSIASTMGILNPSFPDRCKTQATTVNRASSSSVKTPIVCTPNLRLNLGPLHAVKWSKLLYKGESYSLPLPNEIHIMLRKMYLLKISNNNETFFLYRIRRHIKVRFIVMPYFWISSFMNFVGKSAKRRCRYLDLSSFSNVSKCLSLKLRKP